MNIVYRAAALICAMLVMLTFAGCISTGILSKKEAEEFFAEKKAVALDEKTWERTVEVEWPEGKDEETIGFVRAALEILRDGTEPERITGTYRGHRECSAYFDSEIEYEGKTYSIRNIVFAESKNGVLTVQVRYGEAGTDYASINIH
ncbi:MAG: hypothetical protein IKS43_03605 [Clostridia bacterium]|nr:hypothetical protein [Clostridia bacterium]